jgi:hypothetical protein
MEENKVYTYPCRDMESALRKINEVEEVMDWWVKENEGYEYKTSMLIGEDNVTIELTIFQ